MHRRLEFHYTSVPLRKETVCRLIQIVSLPKHSETRGERDSLGAKIGRSKSYLKIKFHF